MLAVSSAFPACALSHGQEAPTGRKGYCRPTLAAHSRGFTLLEILLVVGICALLAALLFPVLGSARKLARRTVCTSQLRQVGMAMRLYQQDADEWPQRLSGLTNPYLNDARLWVCPNDAEKGQREGNGYMEGYTFLASGVSYQYFPVWDQAVTLDWYRPAPAFGPGKWDDLTPLAGCPWHWATRWNSNSNGNEAGVKGWQLLLLTGGAVRRVRVEEPMTEFDPGKLR